MAKEYSDIDAFIKDLNTLPNIRRDITESIDVKKLKKNLDNLNEKGLRRRISR